MPSLLHTLDESFQLPTYPSINAPKTNVIFLWDFNSYPLNVKSKIWNINDATLAITNPQVCCGLCIWLCGVETVANAWDFYLQLYEFCFKISNYKWSLVNFSESCKGIAVVSSLHVVQHPRFSGVHLKKILWNTWIYFGKRHISAVCDR